MCGCLFAIFAVLSPRLAFLLLWIFTGYVSRAYNSFIIPFLGLLFLPFTALMYVLVYSPTYGISLMGWIFVGLAVLIDIGSYGGSAYGNKSRIGY